MSSNGQFANDVAYDPASQTYFDPVLFLPIDDATAQQMIAADRAQGFGIIGIDDQAAAAATTTGGTISPADNQANLNAAAVQAAQTVGLDLSQKSSWSPVGRKAYLDAFKAIIAANPGEFSAATVQTAAAINTADLDNYSNVADVGVAVTNVIADAANSLAASSGGQAIATAAQGLINAVAGAGKTLSTLSALLPFAAIFFLFFAAQAVGKDPGGQFSKAAGGVSKFV